MEPWLRRISMYAPRSVQMIHDSLGLVSLWLEGWPSLNQPPQSCSPLARAVKWQIHLRVTGVITCVICTVREKKITHETFTYLKYNHISGARYWWCSWLRHCATNRKVAGSIPGGVIRIFNWNNPSVLTMVMGLNQPLTEMSTRNISFGGKGGRCVGMINLTTFICRLF
jgi:hypothetical protein